MRTVVFVQKPYPAVFSPENHSALPQDVKPQKRKATESSIEKLTSKFVTGKVAEPSSSSFDFVFFGAEADLHLLEIDFSLCFSTCFQRGFVIADAKPSPLFIFGPYVPVST